MTNTLPPDYPTKKDCDAKHDQISDKLDKIYKRLFEDNGMPCVQTRLDRHDRYLTGFLWFAGILVVAVIGAVVNGNLTVSGRHQQEVPKCQHDHSALNK